MSFRLSAKAEALADGAAAAAGDKNASAWCQRLVIETLSKMSAPDRHEIAEHARHPADGDRLVKAVGNLRQLSLDCFKMSLKSEEQYKEFLNIVIASEEEWESISQIAGQTAIDTSPLAHKLPTAEVISGSPANSSGQENSAEDRIAAEEISPDYLSFAAEMENEVAELIGGEEESANFQDDQANDFDAAVMRNQLPVIAVPVLSATERADAGNGF